MSARGDVWLWMAQRGSAAVLALGVTVHLYTMIIAVQGGLSAAEILTRLQGSHGWLAFYLAFAAAAAVHAPIGMRNVLAEWTALGPGVRNGACVALAVAMLALGARSALAMFSGPL